MSEAPTPSAPTAKMLAAECRRLAERYQEAVHAGGFMPSREERLQIETEKALLHAAIDRLAALARSEPPPHNKCSDCLYDGYEKCVCPKAEDSISPIGLIKFSEPTTALRYLAKRLRSAGISSAVADQFAEAIEFVIARRDDLTRQPSAAPVHITEPPTGEPAVIPEGLAYAQSQSPPLKVTDIWVRGWNACRLFLEARAPVAVFLAPPIEAQAGDEVVLSVKPSEWRALSPEAQAKLKAIVSDGTRAIRRKEALQRAQAAENLRNTVLGASSVEAQAGEPKPLTEEQIDEMALQEQFLLICDGPEELRLIVREVERLHGIQEPKP